MADDKDLVNQDEIERLLQQVAPGSAPSKASPSGNDPPPGRAIDQSEIESLLSAGAGATLQKSGTATAPSPSDTANNAPLGIQDADKLLAQTDIEKLLDQASKRPAPTRETPLPEKDVSSGQFPGEGQIASGDIEYLLSQAQQALESVTGPSSDPPSHVMAFQFRDFGGVPASADTATLDLISDVELDLRIELGRTNLYLEDVLKLRKGSVVPLDKLAGDPVDIFVNGRLIARGEVLVLNDNFCVRVAELIAGSNPAR